MGKDYTTKADVFSYGVVLWEIIARHKPYEGIPPQTLMYRVLTLNERPDPSVVPADCPEIVLASVVKA